MGQYWIPVNITKKEYIHPHKLGCGLKLGEQLGSHPGTGTALLILLSALRERRGGGDPKEDHIFGRWIGDYVVIIGDYAEDSDLPPEWEASKLYNKCHDTTEQYTNDDPKGAVYMNTEGKYVHDKTIVPSEFKDISDDVARVIEKDLGGKFKGDGWRDFVYENFPSRTAPRRMVPDMVVYAPSNETSKTIVPSEFKTPKKVKKDGKSTKRATRK